MADADDGEKWSWATGASGYRVQVRPRHYGGNVELWYRDEHGRKKRGGSLGHPVRDSETGELIPELVEAAQRVAHEKSLELMTGRVVEDADPVTVGELFDRFREDVIPEKDRERRREVLRRELKCVERYLGRGAAVEELSTGDWNGLKRARSEGRIDSHGRRKGDPDYEGREVGPRTVAKTLGALKQVCRFGRLEGLLDADPVTGRTLPQEPDPNRPVCSDERLRVLLDVAPDVTMGRGEDRERSYLLELLVLAADTGQRIGSIVSLRWSDWCPEDRTHGTIRWRGEHQKNDRTFEAPVTERVRETLQGHRRRHPGIRDAWIFPAPDSEGHLRVDVAHRWWKQAERAAEWEHRKGLLFHGLRRRWACKMKGAPLKDVAALGNWKNVETLIQTYQRADMETKENIILDSEEKLA